MVWIFTEPTTIVITERLLMGLSSALIFILFFLANKKISQEKKLTLDKMDKIIFYLACVQITILFFYFLLYTSTFLLASFRTARIIQEIFLCMLLSYILFEEHVQEIIFKIVTFAVVFICAFWFAIAILFNSHLDYNCKKPYWIVFSTLTFFVSLFTVYFGVQALRIIKKLIVSTQEELNQGINAETRDKAKGKSLDELKNKRLQLSVLFVCSIVSSSLQFIWDFVAFHDAEHAKECSKYYVSHNLTTLLLFLTLKFIAFFMPAVSIYYTFYWRNKKNNEHVEENERSLSVFYDYRDNNNEETEEI